MSGLFDVAIIIDELPKSQTKRTVLFLKDGIEAAAEKGPDDPIEIYGHITSLYNQFLAIKDNIDCTSNKELCWWLERMDQQIEAAIEALKLLAPFGQT